MYALKVLNDSVVCSSDLGSDVILSSEDLPSAIRSLCLSNTISNRLSEGLEGVCSLEFVVLEFS